ncbi:hypothetical protein D3C84_1149090 [compost metagenome]
MAFAGSRPKMALRSVGLRRLSEAAISVLPVAAGAQPAPGIGDEQQVGELLLKRFAVHLRKCLGQQSEGL